MGVPQLITYVLCLISCVLSCPAQVRQAYQHKGWVLNNLSGIEQCKNDDYLKALKEQEGEGCHLWGQLTVRVCV